MSAEFMVILFHTTNHAIRAETLLKQASFKVKLVPVPRHLSSDCGVSLRIDPADRAAAQEILDEAEVELAGIHEI